MSRRIKGPMRSAVRVEQPPPEKITRRRKREVDLAAIASAIQQVLKDEPQLSAERLASVAASLKTPVLVTDPRLPDNPVICANPAFTTLTGYAAEEVVGRNCRLLQGPETDPEAVTRIREAIAQRRGISIDILNYRKDGMPFWNELSISPVLNTGGELRYFAGLLNDVTARKAAREHLEMRDAQYRAFFDRAEIGITVTDTAGVLLEVNAAYARILGYTRDELLGMTFMAVTHPDDVAPDLALLSEIKAGIRDHYQLEKRYIRKDGQVIWVRLVVSLIRQRPGVRQLVLTMVEDITEQRQRMEERRRMLERERAVAERLRQLEQWRTAFLRVMAHELRTPLSQIIGFSELLDSDTESMSERSRRYLDHIRSAAGMLETLVQRSFDLLTLHAEGARLDRTTTEVGYLVDTAVAAFRPRAEAAAITLRDEQPGERRAVDGDPQRLHQALSVLLDNAVKYTPAGGSITVTVDAGLAAIEIGVADSGPGVPTELQEAILAGHAEDVLTRRHAGTGMGLLIARRIAELHGGHLRLGPSERGAHFILSLPRAG